jgi:peroxiredoxin
MYRDGQMRAIKINERAPLFEATDFRGKQFSLESALGQGHVLLVFNRGFF